MKDNYLNSTLDQYLDNRGKSTSQVKEREVCDSVTGECYIVREKDGIVERINKKYLTEDGRQLLQD